jgi:hypothetical protein
MIPLVAIVAALAGVLVAAAGYAVAGTLGLFVVIAVAGAAALLLARLRIDRPDGGPPTSEVGRVNAAFSSYRRIEGALTEAGVSRRRYDEVTRPVLTRLLAALLADRRRVDIAKNPGAARTSVGEDVWPLLDPARPPETDPAAPGVSMEQLTTIAERLEEL